MEEKKKNTVLKKLRKYTLFFLLGLVLLLLSLGIALSLPSVQTYLGQKATEYLNEEYGTDITIQEANFSVFGGVKLKQVLIRDHKKDTLFYINR